jgi:hypothetical protein
LTPQEATQRLAALLNELGAEGISVEAGAHGVLCLSTDRDFEYAHVWSANGTGTVWEVL